ncbi:MAG: hypothetical protein IBJ10_01220 [Phycisphaerales bacterium]|nr:hypothetical protein [Phycisphaerales bacterium]
MAKSKATPGKGEDAAWWQQGLTVPRDLAKVFKAEAETAGPGGFKAVGSAAIALYLGAPPHVREALALFVTIVSRKDPQLVTPEAVWHVFEAAMAQSDVNINFSAEWFVNRILDPEVTPAPGQKASDRERGKNGRKAQ